MPRVWWVTVRRFEAMQAGARGYLLKGALRAEILRAIRGVSTWRGDLRARHRQAADAVLLGTAAGRVRGGVSELPEREREILRLIAEQRTNTEIAARLSLPPKTVRNHVFYIFAKLQVASRAEAILRVRDAGTEST